MSEYGKEYDVYDIKKDEYIYTRLTIKEIMDKFKISNTYVYKMAATGTLLNKKYRLELSVDRNIYKLEWNEIRFRLNPGARKRKK